MKKKKNAKDKNNESLDKKRNERKEEKREDKRKCLHCTKMIRAKMTTKRKKYSSELINQKEMNEGGI